MMEDSSVDPEPHTTLHDADLVQDAVPTTPSESLQSLNLSNQAPVGATPPSTPPSTPRLVASAPPLPQDDQQSTSHETRPQVVPSGASVCSDPDALSECDQYSPASKHKKELPPENLKPVVFDAVIIGHDEDRGEIALLKAQLNKLMLTDHTPAQVAEENDNADLGKGVLKYFEQWLDKAQIMFILVTENFCKDLGSLFKADVAVVESFFVDYNKKEFVIPIFVDQKMSASGRYIKPCLRAIRGIDYIDFKWNDYVEGKFKKTLDMARQKIKDAN